MSDHRKGRAAQRWQRPEAMRGIGDLGAPRWLEEELGAPGFEVRWVDPEQAVKDYFCPECGNVVSEGEGHVVVWPEGYSDLRRHWHRHCWRLEARRSGAELDAPGSMPSPPQRAWHSGMEGDAPLDETKDFLDELEDEGVAADPSFKTKVTGAEVRQRFLRGLSAHRERTGLTQTQAAAAMGTSQSAVARLEAGESDPRLSTIGRYLQAVDPDGVSRVFHELLDGLGRSMTSFKQARWAGIGEALERAQAENEALRAALEQANAETEALRAARGSVGPATSSPPKTVPETGP